MRELIHLTYVTTFVLLSFFFFEQCRGATTCEPIDQCSCRMSDSGKVISLWDIDDRNSPRFQNVAQQYKIQYLIDYSPCTPFNKGSGTVTCNNEIVCQHDEAYDVVRSAGRANAYSMSFDKTGLSFIYQGGSQGGITRKTMISLTCDKTGMKPTITAPLETDDASGNAVYTFTLTTICACPGECSHPSGGGGSGGDGGVSIGTILSILFFVFVIVYLVGGILFLKFYKKNEGADTIPQYAFWKDFPSKVKDGFVFTASKTCKKKNGEYEKI